MSLNAPSNTKTLNEKSELLLPGHSRTHSSVTLSNNARYAIVGVAGVALISAIGIVLASTASKQVGVPAQVMREYAPNHWVSGESPTNDWKHVQKAPSTDMLRMIIGVKQTHLAELEKTLLAVSDPDNLHSYGKHLSLDEVNRLIAPTHESVHAVQQWLRGAGVDVAAIHSTGNSDFFSVRMSVNHAEKLLSVLCSDQNIILLAPI